MTTDLWIGELVFPQYQYQFENPTELLINVVSAKVQNQ